MATPAPGEMVPYSYNAGFIVLSYFVSALGCWTALELLHRRTSRGGTSNWFLLAGAATAMGAVAIWSMHFIGMQAITMRNGEPELQITYSPVFTAGSFFLPIIVVAIAFFIFSASEAVNVLNIILGGFISGIAICGMHYVGALSVNNYISVFELKMVIASVVIAIAAASVALGVFFRFKYAWTNAIWKRGICALGLATATSLTHWVGSLGTSYEWRGLQGDQRGLRSSTAIAICGGLAIVCCGVLISFALFWQRVRRLYASRAQQVVVATAIWDPEGRLLLNSGGLLPCRKVTNAYIERSFKDDFTVDHPVFTWIYRVSTNWQCVTNLIAGMRRNLDGEGTMCLETSGSSCGDSAEMTEDYASIFKQLFCVAVQDLAVSMQQRLEDAGILYDRIIDTGTVSPRMKVFRSNTQPYQDRESGRSHISTLGRGQLLFLVRHVDKNETWRLQSNGFKFAPVPTVIDQLAHSMQITPQELWPHLDDLRHYRDIPRPMRSGVHVACFALRPVVGRSFDVLADRRARNLLPSEQLPRTRLEPSHEETLLTYDNWDVSKLLRHWSSHSQSTKLPAGSEQADFISDMVTALNALSTRVGPELFKTARLSAKPFHHQVAEPISIPDCAPPPQHPATVIAFHLVANIHRTLPHFQHDEFVPCRFFLAQQYTHPQSPDHAAFASRVYCEFASLEPPPDSPITLVRLLHSNSTLGGSLTHLGGRSRFGSLRGHLTPQWHGPPSLYRHPSHYWRSFAGRRGAGDSADSLAEKGLVRVRTLPAARGAAAPIRESHVSAMGGVQVSKQVSVISDAPRPGSGSEEGVEVAALGVRTEVGIARERESMMDELMGLALGGLAPSQP